MKWLQWRSLRLTVVPVLGMSLALAACGSSSSSSSSTSAAASSSAAVSTSAASGKLPATIPATFVGDQSGEVAFVGKQLLDGMQLAITRANSSGLLHGSKIVLTVKDTASTVSTATSQMSAAANSPAVVIFGPALSSEALATAPIAQPAKVVDIATLSESTGLLPIGNYIYRLTPSEDRYDVLIADRLAKLGIKTVNLVYASDNPTLAAEATKLMPAWFSKLGIKIGTSIGIPSTTTDFSAIATKLQSGNPQAIGLLVVGPAIGSLATALRTDGYKGQLFADQSATAGSLTPAGAAANGILYAVQYHPDLTYPSSKQFTALFKAAYPKVVPTGYAATGYDAMSAFADAVAKSGSATRAGVLKGMQEVASSGGFQGSSGPTRFVAPDGRDVTVGGVLVQWQNGAEHVVLVGNPNLDTQPVEPK